MYIFTQINKIIWPKLGKLFIYYVIIDISFRKCINLSNDLHSLWMKCFQLPAWRHVERLGEQGCQIGTGSPPNLATRAAPRRSHAAPVSIATVLLVATTLSASAMDREPAGEPGDPPGEPGEPPAEPEAVIRTSDVYRVADNLPARFNNPHCFQGYR